MLPRPECSRRKCKWFNGVEQHGDQEEGEILVCSAFPKGIPGDIAYGNNQHLEIVDGQTMDYVYEQR